MVSGRTLGSSAFWVKKSPGTSWLIRKARRVAPIKVGMRWKNLRIIKGITRFLLEIVLEDQTRKDSGDLGGIAAQIQRVNYCVLKVITISREPTMALMMLLGCWPLTVLSQLKCAAGLTV